MSAEASNTHFEKCYFMKWIITGVCIYFSQPIEYKYTCQYGTDTIEVCIDSAYTAGDSLFVDLNLLK